MLIVYFVGARMNSESFILLISVLLPMFCTSSLSFVFPVVEVFLTVVLLKVVAKTQEVQHARINAWPSDFTIVFLIKFQS
jgi:hypothetical protein